MTEFYNRYIGPPTYIELEDELEYKLYNINATHLIKYPDGKIIESENDALFNGYLNGNIASVQWNIGTAFTDAQVLQNYNATK